MRSSLIQPKKGTRPVKGLNPQQRMFIAYLLADKAFNSTEAAKAAGYASPGSAASILLKNKLVSAELGRQFQKRIERTNVTGDRVILELASIAFSNIQDILKDDDSIRKLSSLPENVARSISSIKVQYRTEFDQGEPVRVAVKEIKFWDKGKALELLAKHLGLVDDRLRIETDTKIRLDYEKLYTREEKPTLTLDPVEYQISNPTSPPITPEKANYSVRELVEDEPVEDG